MSSSPPVSQQAMLIRKGDSELPCPSLELRCTPQAGWQVSTLPTCPPHSTGKLLQTRGFEDKGERKKESQEVFKTTHHHLLICPSVIQGCACCPMGSKIYNV